MDNYNIDQLNNGLGSMPPERKPKYVMAVLAALVASVIVGILLAFAGIIFQREFIIVLAIGAIIVSFAIKQFVPHYSVGGAIIGAIFTPLTFLIYQLGMLIYGYSYEDGGRFWFMLIGSVILGAYIGYNKHSDDE